MIYIDCLNIGIVTILYRALSKSLCLQICYASRKSRNLDSDTSLKDLFKSLMLNKAEFTWLKIVKTHFHTFYN